MQQHISTCPFSSSLPTSVCKCAIQQQPRALGTEISCQGNVDGAWKCFSASEEMVCGWTQWWNCNRQRCSCATNNLISFTNVISNQQQWVRRHSLVVLPPGKAQGWEGSSTAHWTPPPRVKLWGVGGVCPYTSHWLHPAGVRLCTARGGAERQRDAPYWSRNTWQKCHFISSHFLKW